MRHGLHSRLCDCPMSRCFEVVKVDPFICSVIKFSAVENATKMATNRRRLRRCVIPLATLCLWRKKF